jgi:hypothetical protein
VEFAFRPTQISGQHWILSKNSGSFPNWGVYLTGSAGSGRLVAFFNISSTISCSLVSPTASITTGSNYIVDASLTPNTNVSRLYINSETVATGSANGTGSLSATSPLFFSNINSGSNLGTVNSVFNIKTYTPRLNLGSVRQNYNALGNRLGLSSKAWIAPVADSLLDFYPGAAAAYSLRQLSSDYEGYAIRVRNSSDQELDIGFNLSGELDTVTLLNHCGAGDGFVKTWYDQSGNSRDATQATAINQPQIVSNGSIILEGTKPTLQFDGTNDRLEFAEIALTAATGLLTLKRNASPTYQEPFSVGHPSQNYTAFGMSMNEDNNYGRLLTYAQANGTFGGKNGLVGSLTDYKLFSAIWNGLGINGASFYKIYNNGSLQSLTNSLTIGIANSGASLIGATLSLGVVVSFFSGKIQEVILYGTDQSSNIVGLNNNINSFYNIY